MAGDAGPDRAAAGPRHRHGHRGRVDIGLRLDGVESTGRLEVAKSIGQSSMTHKIGLSSPADLDAEALGWLRRACEANV